MKIKASLALPLSLFILLPALAQTTPPPQSDDKDDIVRITTSLVQVDVVVTKDGKPVTNLSADDFEIFQDGRRQTITNFAYISNLPGSADLKADKTITPPTSPSKRDVPRRTIALVVDDLGMSFESIYRVRQQVRKFIAEQLQPDDLVAVIRTGGEMGALQQFTTDRRLLSRAVDQLRWNGCSRVGIHVFSPASMPADLERACGGRSIINTMKALRFLVDAMGELPGRKAMVLFTDDLPRGLVETPDSDVAFSGGLDYGVLYNNLAERAIRSSVVIYAVDTQGLAHTGITAADTSSGTAREIMNRMNTLPSIRSGLVRSRQQGGHILARQTGGFQIRNSNSFGLDRIIEDQGGYYLLGYRPTSETFNRRFHQIRAKVKRSGMTVRTRAGFYGVGEEEVRDMKRAQRSSMNVALTSPFAAQDIEVELASFFTNSQDDGSVIRSFLYLNANDLTFEEVNNRREAAIQLHGVIFGDNGSVNEQVSQSAKLDLSQLGYEHAAREGLRLRFDIPVKRPGSYQMRVAARDVASARVGSAGQFVEVPDLKNKRLAMSGIVLRGPAETPDAVDDSSDIMTSPARRRFSNETELFFGSVIYNATLDPASALPRLAMEAKLFRDAKSIYSSPEMLIDVANQPDVARVPANGRIQLNSSLEPGHYYLQVLVTDKLARKHSSVVQWVDFEIVQNPAQ